ncbi:MAG TPA: PIN domain-containing protein [Bryobacteraceae bacterium]|nr:PIN domain-containing protein [Bryobacteraceae bacterium]
MQVLVDTGIWSLALRRSKASTNEAEKKLTAALSDLIRDDRAKLIGPVRQELLSGIREPAQFHRIRQFLRAFSEPLDTNDYEDAAHLSNQCRARGITGSGVDFLICAVALHRDWQIFTADTDFQRYAKVIPIRLHPIQ